MSGVVPHEHAGKQPQQPLAKEVTNVPSTATARTEATGQKPLLLEGKWIQTDACKIIHDPEDGAIVGCVSIASIAEATRAIAFLPKAIRVARSLPSHRRAAILERTASVVDDRAEAFADLISREGVKTIREARLEVARAVITLKLAAQGATRLTGQTIAFDQRPGSEARTGYTLRVPAGGVLAITPFNDPLNLVVHKLGPAIAAGNAVILKPHEQTPLTAIKLAECLLEAGLPNEILQVLPGSGRDIGPALLAGDAVRLVSFTGGLETGRRIADLAGLKRLEMELGSNCPTLVMADADLDLAAEACIAGAFWAAGQNCLHVQRIIVETPIAAAFRERLVARARKVRQGPKHDSSSDMGCLVNESAAVALRALVEDAARNGARLLTGGGVKGTAFEPTLVENVPDDHPLSTDEAYGPVTVLSEAKDLGHAIARANATEFGLQAAIFTHDIAAAHKAIRELDVGAVMVNDSTDYRLDAMPFGGVKRSGLGREGIEAAVLAMSEPKVVCFNDAC